MKSRYGVETMSEYASRKEALVDLKEYRMSDKSNRYYISNRSTKDWRDSAYSS